MSESGYCKITWSGTGVYIQTTHRPVVIDLIKGLMQTLPAMAVTYTHSLDDAKPHPMDPYYRDTEIRLSKLDGRDEPVAFWLLQKLCAVGWEPFQMRNDEYHLRLRG
ncbi:MAG: hypothetical protein GXY76_08595 [Chloroflexi bacterium]|nr:hypothetical protein [Chloroflexota bacterium]